MTTRRDGAPCIWSIVEDITAQKAAENEIRHSNSELEQFAYAISHDMRQPLRMITSYLQLIGKALAGKLDDETRQYLAFAVDGAKRMDQMIVSLLEFSRIGRKTKPFALLSSREALDEALIFLGPEIETSHGTVDVTGDWPELVASRDELVRLLQNLISNALKYHPEEQIPRVEVKAIEMPDIFRVEVQDQGIGIDPSQTGRLFQVFSRLQSRARFEGSGVGLALCRKIVEHHGGRIGVNSEGEGCGSTFWFELPRVKAP
jgi:light-regulated signal transduction histidine kinase (bacteriophytochrome)